MRLAEVAALGFEEHYVKVVMPGERLLAAEQRC